MNAGPVKGPAFPFPAHDDAPRLRSAPASTGAAVVQRCGRSSRDTATPSACITGKLTVSYS